ncbi:unnamed protein product [Adineta ricciae]|uniref:G-protein coupled receptors family 1 profile domain-containing protein n=1 Tax=Adineta ricciae TaxID=249248 RepID=A0A815L7S0_ADIRI|nr:unnamed protein product [Adineta ricciae]CAF1403346.1 unnamed protein product [Adineta ricciae]
MTNTTLTALITLFIIVILLVHLQHKRTVTMLLTTNTYMGILAFSIVLLSTSIDVLKADVLGMSVLSEKSLVACQFQGFLIYERFGCCYSSFVLQAIYRLLRVLYPRRLFLQSFKFNFICIIIQWIVCFLLTLPSFIYRDAFFVLYKLDYCCGLRYERVPQFLYIIFNVFVLPLIYMSIIYARLIYFVSHQNLQLLQTQQGRRAQRDYIIMRRILLTMIILVLAGIPNLGLAFLVHFKPNLSGDYYMYRIEWMVPSVSMLTLSIGLVFITPRLTIVVVSCLQRKNQVVPQDNIRF